MDQVPAQSTASPIVAGFAAGAPGAAMIAQQRSVLTTAGVAPDRVVAVPGEKRTEALNRLVTTLPSRSVVAVAEAVVLGAAPAETAATLRLASARGVTLAVVVAGEAVGLEPGTEAARFMVSALAALTRAAEVQETRQAAAEPPRSRGGRPRILTAEQVVLVAEHPRATSRALAARLGVHRRTIENTRRRLREEVSAD